MLGQWMAKQWDNPTDERFCATILVQMIHLHALANCFEDMGKMDDPEVF
jgi:hypothetical protein